MNRTTKFACSVATLLALIVVVSTYADDRNSSIEANAPKTTVPVINVRLEVATTPAGGKPVSLMKPVLCVFDGQVATIQLKKDNGDTVEVKLQCNIGQQAVIPDAEILAPSK